MSRVANQITAFAIVCTSMILVMFIPPFSFSLDQLSESVDKANSRIRNSSRKVERKL